MVAVLALLEGWVRVMSGERVCGKGAARRVLGRGFPVIRFWGQDHQRRAARTLSRTIRRVSRQADNADRGRFVGVVWAVCVPDKLFQGGETGRQGVS